VRFSTPTAIELWNRYGAAYGDTIAGFYIPMEVDNDNFATTQAQTASSRPSAPCATPCMASAGASR